MLYTPPIRSAPALSTEVVGVFKYSASDFSAAAESHADTVPAASCSQQEKLVLEAKCRGTYLTFFAFFACIRLVTATCNLSLVTLIMFG